MKKVMLLFVAIFALQSMVMAGNEGKPMEFKELPAKVQKFITTHFPKAKVSLVKEDKELLDRTYEVTFANGESVEFYKNGDWKDVECKSSTVPDAIVPSEIAKKIKEQYPDAKVLKIERDGKGFEVKLSNKMELKFNNKFQIIEIDN